MEVESRNRRIAKDYYTTDLSVGYIGKKHGLNSSTVRNISMDIIEESLKGHLKVDLFKIPPKSTEYVKEILKRHGVQFEVCADYTLTEFYTSKL